MEKYDKIINMPHHTSNKHPRMSMQNRATQFAPFAALTGYEDTILETARITDEKVELSDDEVETISKKLKYVIDNKFRGEVDIVYFEKDKQKAGGVYKSYQGIIKRIDEIEGIIIFEDKNKILIKDITVISNKIIDSYF